jgi:hypothetical protein
MTRAPSPIPVRPVWPERTGRTSDATVRALVAHAFSFADRHTSAESYAAKLFPDDRITELITRAASAPATTTTSGWANTLAGAATLDLISTLGPVSAASELIRRSIQLSFGNNYSVFVPRVISSAGDLEFVAEAAPLPVQQLGIGGVTMTPYTCGGIYTFTSEILRRSVPDLERLTRAVLNESVGLTLDSIMLDANPASATRPAGLRNNITGLTAVAGGGDNADAAPD